MAKFSIVTATYNAGDMLTRTAASLRQQQYTDFEWLIVDGGSTDDTVARIQAEADLVTYWHSEPDEGIADAWNKGITRASGDYVLILNAGDTYDADFLSTLAQQPDSRQIICSHARVCASDGTVVRIFRARPEKLYIAMHLPHNWCAVPRHYYQTEGGYRKLPLAMDFEWFHRYFKRFGADGFRVIDAVLGTYYLGGKSDLAYEASFKANERILLDAGSNAAVVRGYRVLYTLKHVVSRFISMRF